MDKKSEDTNKYHVVLSLRHPLDTTPTFLNSINHTNMTSTCTEVIVGVLHPLSSNFIGSKAARRHISSYTLICTTICIDCAMRFPPSRNKSKEKFGSSVW